MSDGVMQIRGRRRRPSFGILVAFCEKDKDIAYDDEGFAMNVQGGPSHRGLGWVDLDLGCSITLLRQ